MWNRVKREGSGLKILNTVFLASATGNMSISTRFEHMYNFHCNVKKISMSFNIADLLFCYPMNCIDRKGCG